MIRRYINFWWHPSYDEYTAELSPVGELAWSRFVGFVFLPLFSVGGLIAVVYLLLSNPLIWGTFYGIIITFITAWIVIYKISENEIRGKNDQRRD